jgi:copper(I)-binding protein
MKHALFAALLLTTVPAMAQTPGVAVTDAWARATAPSQKVGGAFLTLTDTGVADQLLAASTPIADMVELHETVAANGVMKMLPIKALDLAPGQTVELKPGSYHLMLMGLKQKLDVGATFPLTLTFAHAKPVTATVTVGTAGAAGPAMDHGAMHGGMAMPVKP